MAGDQLRQEYSGGQVGDGITARDGMEQPVYYWDPVIAPSGAQWYTGDAFPQWQGSLFIGGMKARALVRLVFDGTQVAAEEHLLGDRNQRIRDVRQGPTAPSMWSPMTATARCGASRRGR